MGNGTDAMQPVAVIARIIRIVQQHPRILSLLLAVSLLAIYYDTFYFSESFQNLNHLSANPDAVAIVGYKSCKMFMLGKRVLSETPAIQSSVLEMADKEEYKLWLHVAQEAGHVPKDHNTSPSVFQTTSGKQHFVGGLDDLWALMEQQYHWKASRATDSIRQEIKLKALRSKDEPPRKVENAVKIIRVPSLEPQLTFRKRTATKYRSEASSKFLANYKPLMEYFRSRRSGWITGYNMSLRKASVIVVGDQTSAVNAANANRNALLNNIGWGGQGCFGGTKGGQLQCRMELADRNGCAYDSLGIQPAQYRLWNLDECEEFFSRACEEHPDRLWIEKPTAGQHGFGMVVHQGCEKLRQVYGQCKDKHALGGPNRRAIAMVYLDPALIDGHKFDVRTYLVVASLNPAIVLYHDGFVRKAKNKYSSGIKDKNAHITNAQGQVVQNNDHFWDFDKLGEYLAQHSGFPSDYFQNYFRKHAIKVTNFVFQAARRKMFRRPGTFQIFALDWIIDSSGHVHLLEANSNPLVTNYPIPGYPQTWNTLMDIVMDIHGEPSNLGPLNVGLEGKHGKSTGSGNNGERFERDGWFLVFNEAEEEAVGAEYNTCEEFAQGVFSNLVVASSKPVSFEDAVDAVKAVEDQKRENTVATTPKIEDIAEEDAQLETNTDSYDKDGDEDGEGVDES